MDLSDLPLKQRIATLMLVLLIVLVGVFGFAIERGKKEKLVVDRNAAGGMYDRVLESTPAWKLTFREGAPPEERFKGPIARLTDAQRAVIRGGKPEEKGTGAYVAHREAGLYVDTVSGEPLFASVDRVESDSGWASFLRPVDPQFIVQKQVESEAGAVTELRARESGNLIGRLEIDAAMPGGKVYRIYSAALRFVPEKGLQGEGYKEYEGLFGKKPAGP